jgi:hypothetical protein
MRSSYSELLRFGLSSASVILKSTVIFVSEHYSSSCFYLEHRPVYISKQNVSKTALCLRLQVEPLHLGTIDRIGPVIGTTSIDWA